MVRSLFKRSLLLVGPCGLLLVFLVLLSACAQSVSVPNVSAPRPTILYTIAYDANGVEWVGIPPGQLSTAQTSWLVLPAALLVDGPVRIPGILVPLTKDSVTYVWYVPTYYIGNIEDGEKVSPIDPKPTFPGNVPSDLANLLSMVNGIHTDAILAQIPGLNGWVHQTGSPMQNTNNLLRGGAAVLHPLPSGDPNQQGFAQAVRQKGSLQKPLCTQLENFHFDNYSGLFKIEPREWVKACK
jgi:hypothetical protein